jgi:RNA polymerase sigma-70 factor (ECF subfamily)
MELATDETAPWAEWTRRLVGGDPTALRACFDAAYPALLRFATGLTGDSALAADFAQEAFVRVWDRRATLDPAGSLRALLYRTVRNLAANHRRDGVTRARLLADATMVYTAAAPSAFDAPDEAAEAAELADRLRAAIAALPPRQREALTLSRFDGLSHEEVAMVMECAPRTVNNHLVRALETLRRQLAPVGAFVALLLGVTP